MIQDATLADKARVQRHPYHVCLLRTQCSRFRAQNELVQHPARSVGNPRAKAKPRVHISIETCRQLLDVYLPSHSRWRGWHVRLLRYAMRKPGAQVPPRHGARVALERKFSRLALCWRGNACSTHYKVDAGLGCQLRISLLRTNHLSFCQTI